jgi:hypothetical protein
MNAQAIQHKPNSLVSHINNKCTASIAGFLRHITDTSSGLLGRPSNADKDANFFD